MATETVIVPLVSGQELVFQKLDDGAAMRLIRAFFQVTMTPESADANIAFLEQIASHLVTPHDPALIAHVRKSLPSEHPNLRLSEVAHWLAIQIGKSPVDIPIAVSVLTELPSEMMRRMTAAAREGAAGVRVPRGKPRR